eukprot:gb/GEZN01005913.1/.p2 GENE.gb/GEZN01005913.1/~~gb/GEZN01005913.1/.p2  ORF type:complete len:252 (+),score=25.15 gb/GEZN01005913.1/:79-834(+)
MSRAVSPNKRDVVKGRLLCWPSDLLAEKLTVTDELHRFNVEHPTQGLVKRNFISVVKRDGTCVKAYWYFTEKPRICPKEEELKKEMEHVPKDTRRYSCPSCEKRFTTSSHLKAHVRIHTGENPYKCTECDKAFAQSSNLKKHMRIHTGEKPYQCSQCLQSFTQPFHLVRHMRIHTGEKPYKCTQCNEAFAQSSNLKVHVRTHTGEKPYECKFCKRAFAQTGQRSAHIRRLHKTEDEANSTEVAANSTSVVI